MASLLASPDSPWGNTYLGADDKQYTLRVNLLQDGNQKGMDLLDLDPAQAPSTRCSRLQI
jgi:hypothetical protein